MTFSYFCHALTAQRDKGVSVACAEGTRRLNLQPQSFFREQSLAAASHSFGTKTRAGGLIIILLQKAGYHEQ